MITDLNPPLRERAGYFGFSQWRKLTSLDGWTRRRLRCAVWVQWNPAIFSAKGSSRPSSSSALLHAFTNARFRALGLLSMEKLAAA
jgi:hypothetical protein